MNQRKLAKMEQGLSSMARKVLDATPIQEPWTRARITQELARKGIRIEVPAIDCCLNSLKDSGLVREPVVGNFVRVAPPEKVVPIRADREDQPEVSDSPAVDPLERIGIVAKQMREFARQFDAMAAEIENVALEAESRLQKINADGLKLRQLQALLKEVAAAT